MSDGGRHIAFVVNALEGGGAERSSVQAASALSRLGTRTTIIAPASGSYLPEVENNIALRLISRTWPSPSGIVRFTKNLTLEVKKRRVDILITNGFSINRIALMERALGLVPPVVVVERNTLSAKLRNRFPNRLARWAVLRLSRWLYRRADAIVGVSAGVSRDLEHTLGLPAGSVTTIYNPVDTDHIARSTESTIPKALEEAFETLPRPVIITTGRLVAQKAHLDLLKAFAGLPENERGSLVILGEGRLRAELERQADQLGIHDRVWMPGFVNNPWWFIARSDVFALSSHWEGHPRAILEALACKIPIASTDCPSGPREILADTPGTRLTPVGDTRALTQAIRQLLDRPARPDVDLTPYQPEHVARQYLAVAEEAYTLNRTKSRGNR